MVLTAVMEESGAFLHATTKVVADAVLSRFAAVDLESTHIQQKLKVLTKLVGRTGFEPVISTYPKIGDEVAY